MAGIREERSALLGLQEKQEKQGQPDRRPEGRPPRDAWDLHPVEDQLVEAVKEPLIVPILPSLLPSLLLRNGGLGFGGVSLSGLPRDLRLVLRVRLVLQILRGLCGLGGDSLGGRGVGGLLGDLGRLVGAEGRGDAVGARARGPGGDGRAVRTCLRACRDAGVRGGGGGCSGGRGDRVSHFGGARLRRLVHHHQIGGIAGDARGEAAQERRHQQRSGRREDGEAEAPAAERLAETAEAGVRNVGVGVGVVGDGRAGGVGVNLTGADTVIFYDTDWNPAMDLQAQDRCHRIGQTREVHIYRLVTRNTIEENILKKSNQKRQMNNMVIGDGEFNTQFFSKMDPRELLGMNIEEDDVKEKLTRKDIEKAMAAVEDHTDQVAARRLDKETAAQSEEFAETGAAVSKGPLTSHSFESALSPVQRYALRFVEDFDPTNNLRIPLAIATPASVRMKETFAGSSKERKAKSNDIESKIFYPATDGISDYRAHVAFVQKLGFVYDSKIFTPLQFPSNKSFREDQGPTNWGVFSKEDSIKKMLPSTKDRKNKGVLKSFIADSKRKRRLNELDTPPITVRVPLSMLRKFKRKLSRKIGDASDRSKENRLPRKAYYKIKKLRRMYTEGLFPPKMDRVQPSVSPLALKGRPPKPDEATSSDHIPWTQDEENLVQRAHIDFGPNWDLIADILNSNPRVGGRLRTPAACMYHHHLLSVRGHKTDDDLRKESQKRKKKEIPRKKIREGKDLKPRPKSEYVMATPKQPCGNLYPLIDKSMKSINAQRRLSLENDESGSKSIVKSAHASHKKAITESHTRLGLPQLAIGKTLMPHQIIQLRDRCNQQEKAGGRIGATVHSRQQFNSKHSKSSKSHSSASQRKQLAAAQQRRLHQHPSQNSGVGANGKTSQTSKLRQGYNSLLQDKSRTGTTMSRLMPNQSLSFQSQLQANQMKQLPGHKVGSHLQRAQTGKSQLHQISLIQGNPSRSAQMGQPGSLINIGKGTGASSSSKLKGSMSASGRNIGPVGMSNMTTAQLVKYVLSTMPSLKQDVVRILQRKDW
eukprot:CAMPEP_0114528572 /NCGR_PEP_ID=MMETSP0109-20121206/24304_1 /TAXON_ID=29199 /ORGANISM="Chlorarachnion reptans, Strain CCCM449" /LENGTH=1040 /DNA_ID=CAMNT_0001710779 /DNA_START=777 /DNA_END=3897 /DNA_ORIENTATION=-